MAHGRRKAHATSHENQERWLLTYADMITLLMTFFIVLYSMSKTDMAKFAQFSAAMERAFSVEVFSGSTPRMAEDSAGTGATPSIVESLLTEPEFQPDASRIKARLQSAAGADGQAPDVAVGATREGIVIRLSGSYLFESGRAELKPTALASLDTVADELRATPNDIRVEGHTDDIPVDSPRYPTNWELSVARAVAVTRYLTEEDGLPAQRIAAAGYGEFRPVAKNDSREHRAMNRRVEIRILASRPPSPAAPDLSLSAAGVTSQASNENRGVYP